MSEDKTVTRSVLSWKDDALELSVDVDAQGRAALGYLTDPGAKGSGGVGQLGAQASVMGALADAVALGSRLPLVDIVLTESGLQSASRRYSESVAGRRMIYAGHSEGGDGTWRTVQVDLEDPVTGLTAMVSYRILGGAGTFCSQVTLANAGCEPVSVESVGSFLAGGLAGPGGELEDVEVWWAENEWLSEARWHSRAFRDALPDLNRRQHASRSKGRFGFTNVGSWSSGSYLPMGATVNVDTGYTLAWQIEHNGPWHWQVGEETGRGPHSSYLAILGPTNAEHQWRLTLEPGERFTTVPCAVTVSAQGFEGAIERLTRYRRAMRRPHDDHRELPVIFNDYMNTVMGEPTTERLLPLVDAAAQAGSEYFCIDAGWYAGISESWWDTVGEWTPSTDRFPNGIEEVLNHIRDLGMVPGLWIEPEVVGVNSPVADKLPKEAFFLAGGQRVVQSGRYQLDFSHAATRTHLDGVIDSLVGQLGVGYLKMDYNINVAPGNEGPARSPGAGMLAHNRALLEWLDTVLDRYPRLTIENCSSGAMRADYALLARLQLQSTSDQQDYLRYPPIAAASPAGVAPEQAAIWAYPQPEWDDDSIAFAVCTALLGRVHLSGFLDRMSHAQLALVAEGIRTYKHVRQHLGVSLPFWPIGLPSWRDSWVVLGMRGPAATYVLAWRRGAGLDMPADAVTPAQPGADIALVLSPPGTDAQPQVLYPKGSARAQWASATGVLQITLPRAPSACLVEFEGLLPSLTMVQQERPRSLQGQ